MQLRQLKNGRKEMNLSENALNVLKRRYLHNGETPREMFRRVANHVAQNDPAYKDIFSNLMTELKFLPNSPTLMNAGLPKGQLAACFVLPIEDSMDSIFQTLKDNAIIQQTGGGAGFSFSNLRPKNSKVGVTNGVASGPVSFMGIYDVSIDKIRQGNRRRGSGMSVLSVTHPDILDFIKCKTEGGLSNFNISITVTDKFIEAVRNDSMFELIDPHTQEKTMVKATDIWREITEQAWKTGDPGVVFIDKVNRANPTPGVGKFESTNPCVSGDTWVLTDKGPKQVRELVGKPCWLSLYGNLYRTGDNGFFWTGRKIVYKITTITGNELKATKDHLIRVKENNQGKWKQVGEIKIGDKVVISHYKGQKDWFISEVDSITEIGEEDVYDAQVPGPNAFGAGGIVVHNCGEQPLLPYEACNLGSINLSKFVDGDRVNYDDLKATVHLAVRFLDDVIDTSYYPLPQIDEMVKGNRKIGLGIMGFADMLYKLKIPYDSEEGLALATEIMEAIQVESKIASRNLAKERGSFPNIEKSIYKNPIRNATTTTIAPTGTLSIIADCSSGIEPLFALSFEKNVMDGTRLIEVNKVFEQVAKERGFYSKKLMESLAQKGSVKHIKVPADIKKVFVTAHDIAPEWHVRMQAAFQKYVDNAISKTVNLPQDATVEDVDQIYNLAFDLGCKGITIYRDGSKENQVLSTGKKERPETLEGFTTKIKTGMGHLYVTITEHNGKPFEVFATIGKSGKSITAKAEVVGRLTSLALRSGVPVEKIIEQLKGISGEHSVFYNGGLIKSIPDAVGRVLEERYVKEKVVKIEKGFVNLCPECGKEVTFQEGCLSCHFCGYSKCG